MPVSAKRQARIELTTGTAGVDKGVAEARRKLRTFQREQVRSEKIAAHEAKKQAKERAKSGGAFLTGIGQGVGERAFDVAVDQLSNVEELERGLARFQVSASMSTDSMAGFRSELMRVSDATGISRNDILKGASAYVALTGDAAGAREQMGLFAQVSNATGASMDDIAATAAAMRDNLKIDPKDFRAAFDILAKQGKDGAVELRDLATQMANVAPMFGQFGGGKSVNGLAELGAMLQVARKGFGSADEAATHFNGMLTQLQRHRDKLLAAGVNVFDSKGKLKNTLAIVKEIAANKALMKPGALIDALGEAKSAQALQVMIDNLATIDDLKTKSLGSDTIAKDNAAYMATSAGRIEAAWNKVRNAIQAALTPERIEAFAKAIEELSTKVGPLVDGLSKIADIALGAQYKVGKSIRNALGLDSNDDPFEQGIGAKKTDELIVSAGPGASAESQKRYAEAQGRLANSAGYERATSNILGAETNERTSQESIDRAALATFDANSGVATAGSRYLANTYDSGQEVSDAIDRAVQRLGAQIGKQAAVDANKYADALIKAFGSISLKIGSEPIQKAAANSIQHRKGQHR